VFSNSTLQKEIAIGAPGACLISPAVSTVIKTRAKQARDPYHCPSDPGTMSP